MAERAPTSFSHSAESIDFAWPRFHLKMAKIIMKMQLDKKALIFLFVDGFGSLNTQLYKVYSSESAGVISFAFGRILKKLIANNIGTVTN